MTRTNILSGWRDPKEDPKIDAPLLVVYKDPEDGLTFISMVYSGIKYARNNPSYIFLAWQYVPVWRNEEGKNENA